MRDKDGIYFSPNFRFLDMRWNDPENLIAAFKDRIISYYFEPAAQLNNQNQAFAAGLICLSIIDLLANIENGTNGVGFNFKYWLRTNIREFDQIDPDGIYHNLAHRFYKEFRNCLIHECRIKNAGQFSYLYENDIIRFMIDSERNIMIVNPKLLLFSLKNSFERYIDTIKEDESEYRKFHKMMKKNFYTDFESARGDLNKNMDLHN